MVAQSKNGFTYVDQSTFSFLDVLANIFSAENVNTIGRGLHSEDRPPLIIDDEGRPWHAHSRAYALALVGFLGIFLFGYDTVRRFIIHTISLKLVLMEQGLGGGVIALKTFSESFGIHGTKEEIAVLQGNIVSILQGGAFFGALIGGPCEERLGRKWALMVGCVIFIIGGIVQVAVTQGISAGESSRLSLCSDILRHHSIWWTIHRWIRCWSDVCR